MSDGKRKDYELDGRESEIDIKANAAFKAVKNACIKTRELQMAVQLCTQVKFLN
jgi:hypothetical protein